jgi:hypothetical protein
MYNRLILIILLRDMFGLNVPTSRGGESENDDNVFCLNSRYSLASHLTVGGYYIYLYVSLSECVIVSTYTERQIFKILHILNI